ncbi:MAG: hypothetical protein ACOX4L_09690 [Bacillota bacterium]|jgi:hypothetical protein
MGEIRKISFVVHYPKESKNITSFLWAIRRAIKEIREKNEDIKHLFLNNVGLCSLDSGVRVNLYFAREEKQELAENENRTVL